MNNDGAFDTSRYRSPLLERYAGKAELQQALPLETDEHVVNVRKAVREQALALKLSLVDQTKLVTAASELARNTIKYGGGGMVLLERLADDFNIDSRPGEGTAVAIIKWKI